tara:strand:- start:3146 stop:3601 length:456 start_codon:yes stop_codon:yes gene_type:complete
MEQYHGFRNDPHDPDFYLWADDHGREFFLFPLKKQLRLAFEANHMNGLQRAIYFTNKGSSYASSELILSTMQHELRNFTVTSFPHVANEVLDQEGVSRNVITTRPDYHRIKPAHDVGWLPHIRNALASYQTLKGSGQGAPGILTRLWRKVA